jgi:hypothetical protein
MAEVLRVNGGVGIEGVINGEAGVQVGASVKFLLVTVKNVGAAAQDLRPEMAVNPNGGLGLAVEAIFRVCPPIIAYSVVNDASGVINLIVDGHAVEASAVQANIQALGTVVGANSMDVSGTVVALGSVFTIA